MHLAKCLKNIRLANFVFLWHATVLRRQNSHSGGASASGAHIPEVFRVQGAFREEVTFSSLICIFPSTFVPGIPRSSFGSPSPKSIGNFQERGTCSEPPILTACGQDLPICNCPWDRPGTRPIVRFPFPGTSALLTCPDGAKASSLGQGHC